MAISRRGFLGAAAAFAATPTVVSAARNGRAAYVAAAKDAAGFAAVLLDANGRAIRNIRLPRRGHGAATSRSAGRAVIFARRPGACALSIDITGDRRPLLFRPPADRRFSGHGCFSANGALLYAAENDFDAARGVVGVYDVAAGYARVDEFESGGVGPHEILLMRDGATLAVANGGIETHPDLPRIKLNLAEMAPNLTFVDSQSGRCVETAALADADHQISIRHLAETANGEVWWGGQYEGPPGDRPPLIGVCRPGGGIAPIEQSAGVDMRNYVGSVAANRAGTRIAATSPKGGVLTIWEARTRTLIFARQIPDVCGIAASEHSFLASDGRGGLRLDGGPVASRPGQAWDNHLTAI